MTTLAPHNTASDDNSINTVGSQRQHQDPSLRYDAATDSKSQQLLHDTTSLHCTDEETECSGERQEATPSPLPNTASDGNNAAAIAAYVTGSSPRLVMYDEPHDYNFLPEKNRMSSQELIKDINLDNKTNDNANSVNNEKGDERGVKEPHASVSATGTSTSVRRPPPPAALMPPLPSPSRNDETDTAQTQFQFQFQSPPEFAVGALEEIDQARHENTILQREIEAVRASLREALQMLEMRELECVELNQLVDIMQTRLDEVEGVEKRASLRKEASQPTLPPKDVHPVTSVVPSQVTTLAKKPTVTEEKHVEEPVTLPKGSNCSVVEKNNNKIEISLASYTATNLPLAVNALASGDASQNLSEEEHLRLVQELAQAKVLIAEQEAVLDRLGLHFPFPSEMVRAARRIIPTFAPLQKRQDREKKRETKEHHERRRTPNRVE